MMDAEWLPGFQFLSASNATDNADLPSNPDAAGDANVELRADITDVPPDVLALIFAHLNPGHRLDLRSVCRGWSRWVDQVLVGFTHINIVLDTAELRHALNQHPDSTPGALTTRNSNPSGVLALRFPHAPAVRLWLGCRPPAPVAGLNGWNAVDANTSRSPWAASGRLAALAAAQARQRLGHAMARASYTASTAYATLSYHGSVVRENLRVILVNLLSLGLQACKLPHPRPAFFIRPRRWAPQPVPDNGPPPGLRWHVHSGGGGGAGGGGGNGGGGASPGSVKVLRRFAEQAPDPLLEPLSACLPLLGGSTCLTRLSLVTAFDVTDEDLRRLFAAFPRLAALALHAYQAPFADPTTVALTSLELLRPPKEEEALATCAQNGANGPADGPADGAASGAHAASSGSSSVASGSRSESLSAAGASQPAAQPSPPLPPCLPSPSSLLLPAPGPPLLRTLVLSGVCCGWPDEGGLQHLTQLRALVLHRCVGPMHRLVPQIQALTQLTRLELRRLDYHFSRPLTVQDRHQVNCRLHDVRQREARRRPGGQQGQERNPQEGQAGWWALSPGERGYAPIPPPPEADLSESEDSGDECSDPGSGRAGAGGSAVAGCPPRDPVEREEWLRARRQHRRRQEVLHAAPWLKERMAPDWPHSMRRLGRAVRDLHQLRVLVCDIEGPPANAADAWSFLLAGVRHLHHLVELRLPYMVLTHPVQAAQLAASAQELRCLELGSLPTHGSSSSSSSSLANGPALRAVAAGCMGRPWIEDLRRMYLVEGGGGGAVGRAAPGAQGAPGSNSSSSSSSRAGAASCSVSRGALGARAEAGVGAGPGGDGGLSAFAQLRELVLRRVDVETLEGWLPLPPRLQRFEAALQYRVGAAQISTKDLQLFHLAVLPALAAVPEVHLTLAPASQSGPLLVAMLAAWLGRCLVGLDLTAMTNPRCTPDEEVAATCLRIASRGLPRLRRLSCCFWQTAARGPMHPQGRCRPPERPNSSGREDVSEESRSAAAAAATAVATAAATRPAAAATTAIATAATTSTVAIATVAAADAAASTAAATAAARCSSWVLPTRRSSGVAAGASTGSGAAAAGGSSPNDAGASSGGAKTSGGMTGAAGGSNDFASNSTGSGASSSSSPDVPGITSEGAGTSGGATSSGSSNDSASNDSAADGASSSSSSSSGAKDANSTGASSSAAHAAGVDRQGCAVAGSSVEGAGGGSGSGGSSSACGGASTSGGGGSGSGGGEGSSSGGGASTSGGGGSGSGGGEGSSNDADGSSSTVLPSGAFGCRAGCCAGCGRRVRGGLTSGALPADLEARPAAAAATRTTEGRAAAPVAARQGVRQGDDTDDRSAVECINELRELQELRVKVFVMDPPSARSGAGGGGGRGGVQPRLTRVPQELLAALERPLRVVDCAPMEVWYPNGGGVDDETDPREALRHARAAAAAAGGGRCLVLAEVEEWAAGATGLGPEMDSAWRRDAWEGQAGSYTP